MQAITFLQLLVLPRFVRSIIGFVVEIGGKSTDNAPHCNNGTECWSLAHIKDFHAYGNDQSFTNKDECRHCQASCKSPYQTCFCHIRHKGTKQKWEIQIFLHFSCIIISDLLIDMADLTSITTILFLPDIVSFPFPRKHQEHRRFGAVWQPYRSESYPI